MQNPCVMAFRKRLKKRGYADVSIRRIKDSQNYLVCGVEPLSHQMVSCEYSLGSMHCSFKF